MSPGASSGGSTSVAGQTALILGSRVIAAVSTGVLTIVLARLLGLGGYGDYALALTIATLAATFASLGVDSATSRFVADAHNSGRSISSAVAMGLRLRVLIAAIVFGTLILFAGPLASAFGDGDLAGAVRAAGVALFFSAGFSWVTGVYEGVQRGQMLAVMAIVKSVVEFAAVFSLLFIGFGVVAALLGNAVGYLAAVAVGLYGLGAHLRRRLPAEGEVGVSGLEILRYGNHIWLAGVAWLLFERVDLVLLGAFLDTDAVGLYDAPWRVATLLGLLGLSLASSVTPRLASADPRAAGELLTKALQVALAFYVVLGTITAVAASDLVVTLLGSEFARSASVLRILLPYLVLIGLAPLMSRALDYIGFAAARKWIALGAFMVNLVLDLVLIPTIGLIGPAIATNVAILAFVGGHYAVVARHLPVDRQRLLGTLLRATLAALAGGAVCLLVLAMPGPALLVLVLAFAVSIAASLVVLATTGELRPYLAMLPPRLVAVMRHGRGRRADYGTGAARIETLTIVGAALIALGTGVALGRSPALALGAIVGIALLVLLMSDVTIGVVAFVLVQPLFTILGAGESAVSKGAGLVLMGTWLISLRYPSSRRRYRSFVEDNPMLIALMLAFAGWAIVSMLWSIDVSLSIDALQRYALGFLLLGIVFTAARDRRSAIMIAGAFAVSAALSTIVGLAMGNRIDGRFVGTFPDANEYAAFCVPALLIGAALAATATTSLRRVAFAAVSLVCAVGIIMSGSRGGIIAIAAALVVWTIVGGRWRVRVLTASALVALVLVGYLNTAAPPATRDRIATLTQGERYGASAGTGRADIWEVGLRAYRDHPAKGSGVGTYVAATPRYLAQPGLVRRIDFFTETPKVAHNTYLHLLVEVGTVGLVLFAGIILACLAAVARAAVTFRRIGDTTLELLSRTLFAGTTGVLVADFFLSGQYQRILWILLGLCVGLLGLARAVSRREGQAARETEDLADASPGLPQPQGRPARAL